MLDQRGQLLRAALGFAACSMPSYDWVLHALRTWLDSWGRHSVWLWKWRAQMGMCN
jgi:hypothetical protein